MIKPESIEGLKAIVDIVDVIGNYLQLKKVGANYVALCPFHAEKTPSFYVSPSKQIYHCFGCGASGDAIKFIMEYEKVSYPEAVEKLASLYNYKLEYTSDRRGSGKSKALLQRVAEYYISQLRPDTFPYNYLKKRGVTDTSIEKFQLGYAPDSQTQLHFFQQAGLSFPELERTGVIVKGQRGYYPRLIERITFPIHSPGGQVIAFGGRTLGDHPAKYINFTNTPLFNKSRTFYGLHLAREKVVRKREIVITEGYFDVIMLHQGGVENSVATLGTALTPGHLPQLKKLESRVILLYDGDSAGRSAGLKGAQLLHRNYFEGGVALLPEGKDPADWVAEGRDPQELLKEPIPFPQFILEETLRHYNLKNPVEKHRAFLQLKNYTLSLPQFLKEEFAQLVAVEFGVSLGEVLKGKSSRVFPSQNRNFSPTSTPTRSKGSSLPPENFSTPSFNGSFSQNPTHTISNTPLPTQSPPLSPFSKKSDSSVSSPSTSPLPRRIILGEAVVIKTLVEHPDWIDWVVEILPPEVFRHHREELEAVYRGELEHPKVVELSLLEGVPTQSQSELKRQISVLLWQYYRQLLEQIKISPLPLQEKIKRAKEIKKCLQELKKGEIDESGCTL